MSRHFAAYFAIVGTLAFAPGGAANAGQFNIPHINMPRPQINFPTPRLSSPKLTTHNLVNFGNNGLRPNAAGLSKGIGSGGKKEREISVLTPGTGAGSSPGSTSAMPISNTGGGSLSANRGGGLLSANTGGGSPTSRFRVIEVKQGRFAVVEGRSENIVAGGFESSKAAWAWIANHV
jgi:hypothetical protein